MLPWAPGELRVPWNACWEGGTYQRYIPGEKGLGCPMKGGRPGRVHTVCVTLKVVLAALGGRQASLPVKATQTVWPAAWAWVLPPQLSSGNVAPPTNLGPTGVEPLTPVVVHSSPERSERAQGPPLALPVPRITVNQGSHIK